ncbi:glycine betaine ABC transporter substrate-binding protein [Burkholderia gladioli]|uniref:glycine betaine ABC transporter substrate-binding protein n=1 Tax=Burkholderia gladioli TaxID=28095 RepID=UPI001C219450|nr:glycine betaine ABC transporter substrate-binding protein [Burkholderia gladioli]MBU9188607.1 glycine betaine ABC transporter substrate-binding protein [Burkholderia gladioli]
MPASPTITLATIDLSFHHAAAGVVRAVLERHGVAVTERRAAHEAAFAMLADDSADLLCSAWLPGSHGRYFDPLAAGFEKLAVLYTPYALWGVPAYVPVDELASVADLAKPAVRRRMTPLIQGIGPGAGISRFSREIIDHYGLAALGYCFENGTLADCVAAFERAMAARAWAAVPLWRPQFLFARHEIRELAEPNGLLRGTDQATLLIRRSRLDDLPPAAIAELRALSLGNAAVTRLDLAVHQGRDALEAGRAWLAGAQADGASR